MSPARSHVEQSRNTLLFASCAKEVSTNAQVNTVISDKALVKHLQRELDRLENELRTPGLNRMSPDTAALLREKDLQIEKMLKQIEDLTVERDVARSQVQDLLRLVGNDGKSLIRLGPDDYPHLRVQISTEPENYTPETSIVEVPPLSFNGSVRTFGSRRSECSFDENYIRVPEYEDHDTPIRPMIRVSQSSESDSCHDWDDVEEKSNETSHESCKVVRCIETESLCSSPDAKIRISPLAVFPDEESANHELPLKEDGEPESPVELPVEEDCLSDSNDNHPEELPRRFKLPKSRSCKEITRSTWFDKMEKESTPPSGYEKYYIGRPECLPTKSSTFNNEADFEKGSRSSDSTIDHNDNEAEKKASSDEEEDPSSPNSFKSATKEPAETQHDEQVQETQITTTECTKSVKDIGLDPMEDCLRVTSWPLEFKRLQKEIIRLWHACNVSLVHRSYFFLLFNGDPTDSIYMEVERRRLTFLKDMFSRVNTAVDDGGTITRASTEKALRREREMLTKQMQKKLSEHERESLFLRWGIGLNTKYRRIQLANRLWTKVDDLNHVADSAVVVAKLVGLLSDPGQAPKEMFELNFTPPPSRRTYSFKRSLIPLL